jgi:hypothetical protein
MQKHARSNTHTHTHTHTSTQCLTKYHTIKKHEDSSSTSNTSIKRWVVTFIPWPLYRLGNNSGSGARNNLDTMRKIKVPCPHMELGGPAYSIVSIPINLLDFWPISLHKRKQACEITMVSVYSIPFQFLNQPYSSMKISYDCCAITLQHHEILHLVLATLRTHKLMWGQWHQRHLITINSDNYVSNDRMMVILHWKYCGWKESWHNLRYHHGISLKELRKNLPYLITNSSFVN